MNYRYPGLQAFREEDELLFFGRAKETKVLYDLILAQPLVVLFSKSGMGKSSLLQAGILPRLRFSAYDPVSLRLHQTGIPLEQQVLQAALPEAPAGTSLWEALKTYNATRHGVPLLIFDQFEEVFTLYGPEQRATFVRQLADVINGTLPAPLHDQLRRDLADGLSDADALAREHPPRVKIVLSIRSDLLHYLHALSDDIPGILRNRYELRGLLPAQARDAILSPATQAQELGGFTAPAYTFSSEALREILGYLGRRRYATDSFPSTTVETPVGPACKTTEEGEEPALTKVPADEIETFQLQLVCEAIERKIIEEKHPAGFTVTPVFYGAETGLREVISRFYENTLARIPVDEQRNRARRLIEDHLVKSERRVSVDQATIAETHGVAPATLALLVDARLLRRDIRETGKYYELSHDTLVTPALEGRKRWETREANRRAAEAEAEAAEERKQREEAERLKNEALAAQKRAENNFYTAIGFVVVALVAVLVAWWMYQRADSALKEQQKALANVVQFNLKDFDALIYRLEYERALEKIKSAISIGVAKKELSDALLELAFWYAETNRPDRAWGVLDTAYRLAGKTPLDRGGKAWVGHSTEAPASEREITRAAIRGLNLDRYRFLQVRYYPKMINIPGGTDTIGSGQGDEKFFTVTVSPFQVAETEITWWQYNLYCAATGAKIPEKPGWGGDGDNPVINVAWYDAVKYANWLSEQEGLPKAFSGDSDETYAIDLQAPGYRLPTEAEWEYAARAGENFGYAGSEDIDNVGWCNRNSGSRTHPIKSKAPNRWNLYDLSGNVWEWCWDWYVDEYPDRPQVNYAGPSGGASRCLRGGSWANNDADSRLSNRLRNDPFIRNNYLTIGFRVARHFK